MTARHPPNVVIDGLMLVAVWNKEDCFSSVLNMKLQSSSRLFWSISKIRALVLSMEYGVEDKVAITKESSFVWDEAAKFMWMRTGLAQILSIKKILDQAI